MKTNREKGKSQENFISELLGGRPTKASGASTEIGDILIAFKGRNTIIGYGVIKEKSKYGKEELIKNSGHFNYLYVDWIVLKKSIKKPGWSLFIPSVICCTISLGTPFGLSSVSSM